MIVCKKGDLYFCYVRAKCKSGICRILQETQRTGAAFKTSQIWRQTLVWLDIFKNRNAGADTCEPVNPALTS